VRLSFYSLPVYALYGALSIADEVEEGTMAVRVRTVASGTPRGSDGARPAIAIMFFVNGAVLATWVPLIPTVQQRLSLSAGQLGLALLGMAAGALVAMPAAGRLVARVGGRPVTALGGMAYCLALPLPIVAPSLPALVAALALFGACNGAMDVAMNAQGVACEEGYGRPIMSSFHGLFSIGGLVGALASIALAARGVAPLPHALGAALILGGFALLAARWLPRSGRGPVTEATPPRPVRAALRPTWPLIGLGVIGFCCHVGEGSMGDWTALYLRHVLASPPPFAAAGYAAFALAMAVGRVVGDRLTARLGRVAIVRWGAALAAVGLGSALILAQPVAALVGFALVGLGLANIVPTLLGAAGRLPGVAPGPAIAAVTTASYAGFLVGPPLIGVIADVVGLARALGLVVLFSVAVAALAGLVGRAEDARPPRRDGLINELWR